MIRSFIRLQSLAPDPLPLALLPAVLAVRVNSPDRTWLPNGDERLGRMNAANLQHRIHANVYRTHHIRPYSPPPNAKFEYRARTRLRTRAESRPNRCESHRIRTDSVEFGPVRSTFARIRSRFGRDSVEIRIHSGKPCTPTVAVMRNYSTFITVCVKVIIRISTSTHSPIKNSPNSISLIATTHAR